VEAVAWVTLPELLRDVAGRPLVYTAWFRIHLERRPALFRQMA